MPELEEDLPITDRTTGSGARLLFVGRNTPQQDRRMATRRGHVRALLLGVGAAVDFLAGAKPQAPRWAMNAGLEWLFRLATDPCWWWMRYLRHNPRRATLFTLQLLGFLPFSPETRT